MKKSITKQKTYPIDKFVYPVQTFIQQEKSSGIVLGICVVIALFLANSPWADAYFHFFEHKFGFRFDGESYLEFSIYHWINDGLMAVFFFVVGLELKREISGGELSTPRKALLPIAAALGGMIAPALIYLSLNPAGDVHRGWGIPMATDIAFALGVLHLLGKKVPVSLKVFLTALAIVDDLGAVLVIAFFYTSEISVSNLLIGFGFVSTMIIGNKMGIRNLLFYAVLGILGVWVAFLTSGVHATIASVMAAFTIPADVRIGKHDYIAKIHDYLTRLKATASDTKHKSALSENQLDILAEVKQGTNMAIPPLQRLEQALHPFATFIIVPIFALANTGVSMHIDPSQLFGSVATGAALGLLAGKTLGVVGTTLLLVKLKLTPLPQGMGYKHLLGMGLLASIGFTMSLFITSLAFTDPEYILQAKIGIFSASILGGLSGYILLKKAGRNS
ncbi:MAG: Na+/H+ antiporter NhaA [Tannerellaceae bacterium]|jgi:NhaA family Na+:H+ antiporter|nr:Na+/H+ antiporter NhaA [Tannerellaceae bacterium]